MYIYTHSDLSYRLFEKYNFLFVFEIESNSDILIVVELAAPDCQSFP